MRLLWISVPFLQIICVFSSGDGDIGDGHSHTLHVITCEEFVNVG